MFRRKQECQGEIKMKFKRRSRKHEKTHQTPAIQLKQKMQQNQKIQEHMFQKGPQEELETLQQEQRIKLNQPNERESEDITIYGSDFFSQVDSACPCLVFFFLMGFTFPIFYFVNKFSEEPAL